MWELQSFTFSNVSISFQLRFAYLCVCVLLFSWHTNRKVYSVKRREKNRMCLWVVFFLFINSVYFICLFHSSSFLYIFILCISFFFVCPYGHIRNAFSSPFFTLSSSMFQEIRNHWVKKKRTLSAKCRIYTTDFNIEIFITIYWYWQKCLIEKRKNPSRFNKSPLCPYKIRDE